MRSSYICVLVAFILAGCSGGGSGGQACGAPQTLMVAGYSTGSAPVTYGLPLASSPYPASATYLYFSEANGPPQTNAGTFPTFTGTPVLTGSDGTTITGGTLVPIGYVHLSIAGQFGYYSHLRAYPERDIQRFVFVVAVGSNRLQLWRPNGRFILDELMLYRKATIA